MMAQTNKKRGSGKIPGSSTVNGRGHATIKRVGEGIGDGNNCCGKKKPNTVSSREILAFCLSLVGFGEERQAAGYALSETRFRGNFGVGPQAIKALIKDMKRYDPEEVVLSLLFMAINWLVLYSKEVVMAGRWGYGEKHCRKKNKRIRAADEGVEKNQDFI